MFGIEENKDRSRGKVDICVLGHRLFSVFLSKRKMKCRIAMLEQEIKNLHNLMTYAIDITKIPCAKGELREKQLAGLALLEKVGAICKENNLLYWLDFGTLLGAVRHKGFVPWDDDIDICVLRRDYEKLRNILKQEFANTDISVRETHPVFPNRFQLRISQSGDTVEMDIFPVDEYVVSKVSEKEKISLNERIKKAQGILNEHSMQNEKFKSDINSVKQYISYLNEKIICPQSVFEKVHNPLLYYGIDWAHTYRDNTISFDTIFPLSEISFEGKKFPCPNRATEHLQNLYGNYDCFPKVIYREV